MTETTPTLLAAHDALESCLDDHRRGDSEQDCIEGIGWVWACWCECGWHGRDRDHRRHVADALLATVVRDVATLAVDETLVEAVAQAFNGGPLGIVDPGYWEHMPGRLRDQYRITTRHALTALAAALGGDQ